jgi:hypothetical protein
MIKLIETCDEHFMAAILVATAIYYCLKLLCNLVIRLVYGPYAVVDEDVEDDDFDSPL